MSGAEWPARYEIRIDGLLDAKWSEWFGGLRVEAEGDQTILSGSVADKAALCGVLDNVCALGLSVIEVRRFSPGEEGDAP